MTRLDLSGSPPIFVSATQFDTEDLQKLEDELVDAKAVLAHDVDEAEIIVTKVTKKARIQFDLRAKGLWTQELKSQSRPNHLDHESSLLAPPAKKRELNNFRPVPGHNIDTIVIDDDSSTHSENESIPRKRPKKGTHSRQSQVKNLSIRTPSPSKSNDSRIIKVVTPEWFTQSKNAGQVLPLDAYLSYEGVCIEKKIEKQESKSEIPSYQSATNPRSPQKISAARPPSGREILERAQEDSTESKPKWNRFGHRKFGLNTPSANPASWEAGHGKNVQYAHLLQEATTEHNDGSSSDIPEMPEWVKKGVKYACQRSTPANSRNEDFIQLLKKIKLARVLTNDEIGVRAYSTSIAAIAAYEYTISSPREIMALPGCDSKIANLYVEWINTGKIQAVEELEADEDIKVLRLFYEIWGVGSKTAREFYYDKGWRDLDDIVEFGWPMLSRVQQIGVKFYDEFQELIPRAEVEMIGRVVHQHAVKVRDEGIQTMIVGGYRRGKEASGDVDLVISHPDDGQTLNIVNDIVASLEEEDWITHTLLISLHNTNRCESTLPFRAGGGGGHGFDTLDKALVVWQDPTWPTKETDLEENPNAKNPNIHRRVDIIISPWRTVGCAVAGWSSGTTFQRDLRRYAKNAKGWKFDSSGVRDRRNGEVIDLEGYYSWKGREGQENRAKTMDEAEKRVFEGMGLQYRPPEERCTG